MSHLFQRPLCEMGRAYDYAYRPVLGDPDETDGGGCDDRPHRAELWASGTQAGSRDAEWLAFALCPEHETQLRRYDDRLVTMGRSARFRTTAPSGSGR